MIINNKNFKICFSKETLNQYSQAYLEAGGKIYKAKGENKPKNYLATFS